MQFLRRVQPRELYSNLCTGQDWLIRIRIAFSMSVSRGLRSGREVQMALCNI